MNTTLSSGMTPEMKTYYDKKLLSRMVANMPFVKYGQKRPIPKNNGKTIQFRRFNSLEPATTPLTEGQPPVAKDLSVTEITTTLNQFGSFVETSDVLELTAIDPIINETVEVQGEQAGETLNMVVRDELLKTTSVYNVGGHADEDEITATDVLTADDVLNVQTIFKRSNIKPVSGRYYIWFIAPEQAADIMRDPLWRDVSKYANDAKDIEDGEIGRLYGFKFVDTTMVDPIENAKSVNVYSGLAFGKEAYGVTDIENGSKPKTIIKPCKDDDSDKSDPLNQKSTIGWKAMLAAVRLNELALMKVSSAATEIA